ncbi:MAG TPA: HK97 family phage prohead protease [Nocardioidaceae bacterium]|nr:HK97 family phage prohead protease [Nocardioidaceae bacterium]
MTDFIRAVALDDIRIRKGGSGRVVEAYAAVFNEPAEIYDQDGHYLEVNDPAAFNRSIQHHGGKFPVVYNHGMTIAGTPSDRGSVPIGVSVEVRADKRGVLTVSEYGNTPLADEVLESIRQGSVKAQSYGGAFLRSDPGRRPAGGFRPDGGGKLRTVRRMEIKMREFGPTPFPAFSGAAITGVRAQQVLGALLTAPAERRVALLQQLDDLVTPEELDVPMDSAEAIADTPAEGPAGAPTEDPAPSHSRSNLNARIRAFMIAKGLE